MMRYSSGNQCKELSSDVIKLAYLENQPSGSVLDTLPLFN